MAKPLKIILGLFGGLLLLLIATAIALPFVVDPNDLRGRIVTEAKSKTGRDLVIGHLGLKVFPWLKVTLDDVSVSNAPGFGSGPMLAVKHAEAGVKLLPLLREKRLEVSTVKLEGATAALAVNREGRNNWQDLTQSDEASSKPASDGGRGLSAFAVEGIAVRDTAIRFQNAQTGLDLQVSDVAITTGAIGGGAAVPVDASATVALAGASPLTLRAQVKALAAYAEATQSLQLATPEIALRLVQPAAGTQPELAVEATLTSAGLQFVTSPQQLNVQPFTLQLKQLRQGPENAPALTVAGSIAATPKLDLGGKRYALDNLRADLALGGSRWPKGQDGKVTLTAEVLADLAGGTLRLSQLQLAALGLDVGAKQWTISPLSGEAAVSGDLKLAPFSPRKLLAALGVAAPNTADEKVLGEAMLATDFTASAKGASLKGATLKLDDTTLRGSLAITDFTSSALRFDLAGDALDADRYLPPKAAPKPGAPPPKTEAAAATASPDATEIPVKALDGLNASGTLKLASLKLNGLKFSNAQWTIDAPRGGRKHQQITSNLYGGRGTITLDVTPGARPGFGLKADLASIDVQPLLKDLSGNDKLSGQGSITLDVTSAGRTVGEVKRGLDGTVGFNLANGAVKGFNLAQMVRKGVALARLNASEAANAAVSESRQTDFAALKGTGRLQNGVLTSDDLSAANPLLRLTGAGQLDLVNETINYLAKPVLVNTATGQAGKDISQLAGIEVPIRLTGNLYAPKVAIDWQAALQQQAASKLREKLGVSEQQVREQREALRQKAKDEISKGLMKLFGNKSPPAPAEPPPNP